jgi:RNA polymerase sigma-70 factor (ECF subfamily)
MNSLRLRCNYLIKKIQKGNEKALEDLFKEFGFLFLNMAKKYLYDKSQAEDLISEVFVDLIKTSGRSFDNNKNGLNWLFTIIRRKAYKYNGNISRAISIEESGTSYSIASYMVNAQEMSSEKSFDILCLEQAIEKLNEEEKTILYYKYWEGLTVREIAKKLDKPRSTIQYKIDEILKKLKRNYILGDER